MVASFGFKLQAASYKLFPGLTVTVMFEKLRGLCVKYTMSRRGTL